MTLIDAHATPATSRLFPELFTPIQIGGIRVRNRIVSSGHDTVMVDDGRVTDRLLAYHEARAAGGVGLIVVQVGGVHETARYTSHVLMADDDGCIPGYRQLAERCHAHGSAVVGQLFHPGREILESSDGTAPVAWAPSAVPSERFRVMPRAMTRGEIAEVVEGYAAAAARLQAAGLDGVEVVASHGYLPAQFLNPHVNLRTDEYGGSAANRRRFLIESLRAVRAAVLPGFVVGLRVSGDELSHDGLAAGDTDELMVALESEGIVDYVSVCAGSSATLSGSLHIAPPMSEPAAYVAPIAARVKEKISVPVMVAGRINQPQEAEMILARGQADLCAMTRALICDPDLPRKAVADAPDEIRACIACNQACIGHFQKGYPISCIQHPETGREQRYGTLSITSRPKSVMVVGAGPGGMKAAVVAANRGHDVTLYEAARRIGGQVRLAEQLPGRSEFGGVITNLAAELQRSGVKVVTGARVDAELIRGQQPDVLVLATGARPRRPVLEVMDEPTILDAWEVISGAPTPTGTVVVSDWRGDWIGLGVATQLARTAKRVVLGVTGYGAGEALQQYVRSAMIGDALAAGVEVVPNVRVIGIDEDTVYFQNTITERPQLVEGVDALVLAEGHESVDELVVDELPVDKVVRIGDCVAPRSVEEAILEGLVAASEI